MSADVGQWSQVQFRAGLEVLIKDFSAGPGHGEPEPQSIASVPNISGLTGAFRTTPTAALEVATGLALWIEEEARASYFRICRLDNVTQRGKIAHFNFSRDMFLRTCST